MSKVLYVSVIGCLMYVMVCTKSYMAQVISQVCKFMSKSRKCHWEKVKCIFKYLKGTTDSGSMFSSEHGYPFIVGMSIQTTSVIWMIEDLQQSMYWLYQDVLFVRNHWSNL